MTVDHAIRLLAGIIILLSLGLAQFAGQVDMSHVSWLWLNAFIGLNLIQSSFTKFCPPEWVFRRLGLKHRTEGSCD